MKTILIVEDDHRLSETISSHLEKEGFICKCAFDGQMALKFFANESFDLVILDVNLPKVNGFDVCRTIRIKNPQIAVLMITAFGDIESKIEAFETGADDCIVKPFHIKELIAKVRVFLKRAESVMVQQPTYEHFDLKIDPNSKEVVRAGKQIALTPKEYSLLVYLIQHKGRVISKDELARNLWDVNYGVTQNTIEVYVNFLRNKIDRDFEPKLVLTKPGFGYYILSSRT